MKTKRTSQSQADLRNLRITAQVIIIIENLRQEKITIERLLALNQQKETQGHLLGRIMVEIMIENPHPMTITTEGLIPLNHQKNLINMITMTEILHRITKVGIVSVSG